MAADEQQQGRIRRLLGRVAPGLDALSRYQVSWLRSDIAAGLSVAAVALPVGTAYADLAGVPPVMGIYAAIFPPFACALFGSSRQMMIGPDAATCMMPAAALGPLAGGGRRALPGAPDRHDPDGRTDLRDHGSRQRVAHLCRCAVRPEPDPGVRAHVGWPLSSSPSSGGDPMRDVSVAGMKAVVSGAVCSAAGLRGWASSPCCTMIRHRVESTPMPAGQNADDLGYASPGA